MQIGTRKKSLLMLSLTFYMCLLFIGCVMYDNREMGRYGLVYGVSSYNDTNYNLVYSTNDAKEVAEVLSSYKYEVLLRLDKEVTKENILNDILNLAKRVYPKDIVVFYFSGRGKWVDGEYYIIPSDGEPSIKSTLLSVKELDEWLSWMGTQKIVILLEHIDGSMLSNYTVIYSAENDGRALEFTAPVYHGIFTYFLIKGLKEKNADLNIDKMITATELYSYIYPNVTNAVLENVGKLHEPKYMAKKFYDLEIISY